MEKFRYNNKMKKTETEGDETKDESMANARRSHDKKLDRFFINLDDTQCGALHSILDGNSVFITGSAGTGKSFLLNRAISMMKSLNQHVHITGSTGVAACNIGGTTLHSFAGIRLGTATLEKCITMVTSKARSVKKYTKCDKLIIDEVSMVQPDFLDKIDQIARHVRKCPDLPFGGIQVIACGDFFQLPPVCRGGKTSFAFHAAVWPQLFPSAVQLQIQHRQAGSDGLADILDRIRRGCHTSVDVETLTEGGASMDRSKCTRLFGTNEKVDAANEKALAKIDSPMITSTAKDFGQVKYIKMLMRDCPAGDVIGLKIGARVMLLKNYDVRLGLVNGACGTVVAVRSETDTDQTVFHTDDDMSILQWSNELRHKSAEFGNKHWYSAKGCPGVVRVEFDVLSRDVGRYLPLLYDVPRYAFSIEEDNTIMATRHQLPLTLAYAITIHKSQGTSVQHLRVDCKGMFSTGQAYVGLSRARNLSTLRVSNLSMASIRTSRMVQAFDKAGCTVDK